MKLSDKLRCLREIEGSLRGLDRALTQSELVRALRDELGEPLSQSYLSQIESGARPHLTNASRLLLARFFKVHPGYLVDDPEGYHAELVSDIRETVTADSKLDAWLAGGAERFRKDPELAEALSAVARHEDSRGCLLLLETVLQSPDLAERLFDLLRPSYVGVGLGRASNGPDFTELALKDLAPKDPAPKDSGSAATPSQKGAVS